MSQTPTERLGGQGSGQLFRGSHLPCFRGTPRWGSGLSPLYPWACPYRLVWLSQGLWTWAPLKVPASRRLHAQPPWQVLGLLEVAAQPSLASRGSISGTLPISNSFLGRVAKPHEQDNRTTDKKFWSWASRASSRAWWALAPVQLGLRVQYPQTGCLLPLSLRENHFPLCSALGPWGGPWGPESRLSPKRP